MNGSTLLFLMAVVGVSSPLFTLSGMLPGEPADRPDVVGQSLRIGLLVLVFALPSHFLLQAVQMVLPGMVWIGVLAPISLGSLYWAIHSLLSRSGILSWFTKAGRPVHSIARSGFAAAGLVLYPFLDPALSGLGFIALTVFFLGNACGYLLLVMLIALVRERIIMTDLPEFIRGTPVIMVITGLLGLALLGFISLLK